MGTRRIDYISAARLVGKLRVKPRNGIEALVAVLALLPLPCFHDFPEWRWYEFFRLQGRRSAIAHEAVRLMGFELDDGSTPWTEEDRREDRRAESLEMWGPRDDRGFE